MRAPSFVFVALVALAACKKEAPAEARKDAPAPTAAAAPQKPVEAVSDALTFTVKAPAVGDKSEEKETSEMNMALDVDVLGKRKSFTVRETESMVKRTEVLAVDGKAITKARVTFVEKKKATFEEGKEKKKPRSPIDGKTYVLEMKAGKLEVSDEKGKKPSAAEVEAVRATSRSFGKPDPVLSTMPATPIRVGDKVEALAKGFQDMFLSRNDGKDAPRMSDVEVTLASIEKQGRETVGVFSMALTMSASAGPNADLTVKAPLQGTFRVRVGDSWPTAVSMAGALSISSEDPKLKIGGKGDLKMTVAMTY